MLSQMRNAVDRRSIHSVQPIADFVRYERHLGVDGGLQYRHRIHEGDNKLAVGCDAPDCTPYLVAGAAGIRSAIMSIIICIMAMWSVII